MDSTKWLTMGVIGYLRSHGQQLQAVLTHEHGVIFGGSITSTTGKGVSRYLSGQPVANMVLVPLVSLWCHSRRPGEHGHQCHCAGRDCRTSSSNIPDQDRCRQILTVLNPNIIHYSLAACTAFQLQEIELSICIECLQFAFRFP